MLRGVLLAGIDIHVPAADDKGSAVIENWTIMYRIPAEMHQSTLKP
jgi:hypothetical protein